MYRRDYIQRIIEEVARALGKAMGLRKEGLKDEALRTVQEAYPAFFSMEHELVVKLHPDDMLTFFSGKYELNAEQLEALSKVFEAEGSLLVETNLEEAQDRYAKALVLLTHLEATDTGTFSLERKQRIASLKNMLT